MDFQIKTPNGAFRVLGAIEAMIEKAQEQGKDSISITDIVAAVERSIAVEQKEAKKCHAAGR